MHAVQKYFMIAAIRVSIGCHMHVSLSRDASLACRVICVFAWFILLPLAEACHQVGSRTALKDLLSKAGSKWFKSRWADGDVLTLEGRARTALYKAVDDEPSTVGVSCSRMTESSTPPFLQV